MEGTNPTLSLDRYPDPAIAYASPADRPVARAVNRAFERRFGPVESGTALSAVLDRFDVVAVDGGGSLDPTARQRRTVRARASAPDESERYLVRTVPPSGQRPGSLLFVAAPATGGVDPVASVVSHDLRNPLDVAKAHLRAARETGEPEHFDRVADAHDRIERIVGDVLTLARGEAAIDPSEEVDLEAVVERARETVHDEAAAVTVADALPTVAGDRDRLARLFENLLRNCVEHGARGRADDGDASGRVRITVGCLDDRTGVYVADDGPGIPAEERSAVFEPGYTTADRGTGLGLAIVRRIAEGHGWSVTATESTDGGARIEIAGVESVR